MDKGTKVELQDSFDAWVEIYHGMDFLWERKGPQEEDLKQCLQRDEGNVGTNCDKNRGHIRKGVVVITTQQHERGNIWNIIVIVS